jgi:hypothetical protein
VLRRPLETTAKSEHNTVQQKGTSNLRVLAGFEFVAGRISTAKNITAVKSFL